MSHQKQLPIFDVGEHDDLFGDFDPGADRLLEEAAIQACQRSAGDSDAR